MKFLFSSIGQKVQIACSGLLLAAFLFFHLINNLTLFYGEETFNSMVLFLESIKPVVRILEFSLLAILIIHTINALKITISNKKARSINYNYNAQPEISAFNARTMAISGSIILLFLIIHLSYIWYTYQTMSGHDYFNVLLQNKIGFLGHFPTSIFYIISIILISFHLQHGFQSALKTFGITKQHKLSILYNIAIFFWAILPLGFILIIISIQLGFIT